MAICQFCDDEMHTAEGCVEALIVMADGKMFEPVRYGAEPHWRGTKRRCGDCNVLPGHVHHHGCDIERCPRCRQQSISCGCIWKGEEHLADDWEEEWEARLGV
jgi:hypothetical protein